jgi:large subunit ribosomal protein L6
MSRIGKQPIALPDGVTVTVKDSDLTVEGPLGKLRHTLPRGITCAEGDAPERQLVVRRASENKRQRELHGLTRTLINNMVVGVTKGFQKELEIHGIGYSVKLSGDTLDLQLGFANTVRIAVPGDLKADVKSTTNPGQVVVSGCDKQRVGQLAARIWAARKAEPYQGKGVRYAGEEIRRKAGKAFVGAG